MREPLRFLSGFLAPGGVLLLAAWAVQKEEVVRDAAAPYAIYFCFGALTAAVLLSWYHDQSRLLSIASAVALTTSGMVRWPDDPNGAITAALFLVPLNITLFAWLKESGVMTFEGLSKAAIVFAQAAGVGWMAEPAGRSFVSVMRWGEGLTGWSSLPFSAELSFEVAAAALLVLAFVRRTKVEQGVLWALVAMFLALNARSSSETLLFYAGTAGLVLVFAILEHGYDIAYRDELTGLLGRRAFNSMMEQLGRTYAFAMCDVDHFKKFNDTYGHDAGDQVLRMVAAKLSQIEGGGRVFRYGGEEFLVVFRGRTAREAEPFVESVRQTIAGTAFVLRAPDRPEKKPRHVAASDPQHAETVQVTISAGLADKSKRHSTPELVLDAADSALYAAKASGRNCVRLDESTPV